MKDITYFLAVLNLVVATINHVFYKDIETAKLYALYAIFFILMTISDVPYLK